MRAVSLWPDDDLRTCFLVASGTLVVGV